MKADIIFRAEDIDDAFLCLATHFMYLNDGVGEDPQLIEKGKIEIKPLKDE
jgi:hypothetical protein